MQRSAFLLFVFVFFSVFFLACSIETAHAAVTWTGSLDPADPTTWTSSTTAYIGKSGLGTLTTTDGGLVSNYHSYLGYEPGSTGDVTVDGVGSAWINSGELYIGNSGNGTLIVTNGGFVSNTNGYVGESPSGIGLVSVDGVGAAWNNGGDLYVGNSGGGTLNVTAGGAVASCNGHVGYDSGSTGAVTVDGIGSAWNNSGAVHVGGSGEGTLTISASGVVSNTDASIGDQVDATGEVTVSGIGSTWTNSGNLSVGHFGNGTLTIADGAAVSVARDMFVAKYASATGSICFETAGGTLSTRTLFASPTQLAGTGNINARGLVSDVDLTFNRASDLTQTLLFDSELDQNVTLCLDVSDPGNAGTLGAGYATSGSLTIRGGTVVSSSDGYLGYKSGSNGTASITGTGSTWNTNNLLVGHFGNGSLAVTNGGSVRSNSACIAGEADSSGIAMITGSGSAWVNQGVLDVGRTGNGTLAITNSGTIENGQAFIGNQAGATGKAMVSGPGSMWTNNGDLYVGNAGSGTLSISVGASVTNGHAYIGHDSSSTGEVVVTGPGSTWLNDGNLSVGHFGNGTLTLTNGGAVGVALDTFVAAQESATGSVHFGTSGETLSTRSLFASPTQMTGKGNVIARGLVSDVDLTFDGPSSLTQTLNFDSEPNQNITVSLDMSDAGNVGALGAGYVGNGSITIQNGAVVSSTDGYLGYKLGSTGNASIADADSAWNTNSLLVGQRGDGLLAISNGASVGTNQGCIGSEAGSSGIAMIVGTGSSWNNQGDLDVGCSGCGTLAITNGATVESGQAFIGRQTGAAGEAAVGGAGSRWTTGSLFVGGHSTAAGGTGALLVEAGGTVDVTSELKVWNTGSLELSGSESQVNVGSFIVETGGAFAHDSGTLTVLGGTLDPGTPDYIIDGTGNPKVNLLGGRTALSGDLYVGYDDSGTLTIADGSVTSNHGIVGYNTTSSAIVTLTGADSTWSNSEYLFVGYGGTGTFTQTGGTTSVGNSVDIARDESSHGIYTLSGADSTLTADYRLYVGLRGTGTFDVSDGASVNMADDSYIACYPTATGSATISGADSTWTSGDDLYVGFDGQGSLMVSDGATASAADLTCVAYGPSTGTLEIYTGGSILSSRGCIGYQSGSTGETTVDGEGSTWTNTSDFTVGYNGQGSLIIDNGGLVSNTYAYIGRNSGSSGEVTVTGNGSTWTNTESLNVGYHGNATLQIAGGASVTNTNAYIGNAPDSTGEVTVTGTGSTWINTDNLHVGANGNATLTISDEASVTVGNTMYVARYPDSSGMVVFNSGGTLTTGSLYSGESRLSGTGTIFARGLVSDVDLVFDSPESLVQTILLNNELNQNITIHLDLSNPNTVGNLGAGYEGAGSIVIRDGMTVQSVTGRIAGKASAVGQVTVTGPGSTWINTNSFYVGHDGTGTLTVTDGGTICNSDGFVGAWSNSHGEATVSGAGSKWINTGNLAVGHEGTGLLSIIDNGLVSVAGTLTIDHEEDGDGFINMSTGGMLAILGNADDSLASFLSLIEGTNAIRYWDNSISDWANITEATHGQHFTLDYLTEGDLIGYTLLTVATRAPGDCNCDDRVDQYDAAIMSDHWCEEGGWTDGDFNGDGFVNVTDASIMAANWGYDGTGESSPVPEPMSIWLAFIGSFMVLLRRGNRNI